MADLVMPRLSDSMEEGTILKWLKSIGDEVALGDELVEIETDKANMVYEADTAGTLSEIVAAEGETLAIGEVIARVGSDTGASAGANGGGSSGSTPAPPATTLAAATTPPVAATSADGERVKVSPIARRIAGERGVDLAALQGSGPGGRIVKADVEGSAAVHAASAAPAAAARAGASETPETAKGTAHVQELTKLQLVVARRMSESKATAPHFYLEAEIDMSRCVEARARIKASATDEGVVPSFNDMVVKACGLALREFPRANGAYKDGRFELYSRVNVGIAVAGQDALVVPTIFDADRKGLREIAADSRELAQRVRDAAVTPPELSGGTFTVSNLGMYGISSFAAVINRPQAGILAVGAIVEKPVVRDGEIAAAHMMGVNLACDHRILYGAEGAEFLGRIRALLEEPLGLAL